MKSTIAKKYNITLSIAIAVACLWYAMSIYTVVTKASALKSTQSQLATLAAETSALEGQYLSLSKNIITPQALHKYGFQEGVATAYISRTTALGRATY